MTTICTRCAAVNFKPRREYWNGKKRDTCPDCGQYTVAHVEDLEPARVRKLVTENVTLQLKRAEGKIDTIIDSLDALGYDTEEFEELNAMIDDAKWPEL